MHTWMRFCVHSLILLEKKEAVNNTIILQYIETNLILTAFYSQAALLSLIVHSARVNSCQRYTCTLLQPQALASSLVLEIQVYTVITTGTCAIPCVRNTGVQGYNHRCLCQKYMCTLPLPGAGIRNTHVHHHTHRCLCQKYTCTLPQPQTLVSEIHMHTATTTDACVRNTHVHCHNPRRWRQKYTCTLPLPRTLV